MRIIHRTDQGYELEHFRDADGSFFTVCDHGKGTDCPTCDYLYFVYKFQRTIVAIVSIMAIVGCALVWGIR